VKSRKIGIALFIIAIMSIFAIQLVPFGGDRIQGQVDDHHAAPPGPNAVQSPPAPDFHASENVLDVIARAILSITLLIAALFVILTNRYSPQDKHWAYGTIGTLIGFWLKL
jgi:hypothetical protein